jgi:phosphohistidine phosphatase SixA
MRHGHYACKMWVPLDELGEKQIQRMCVELLNFVGNRKMLILSSDENRAVQSAEIISVFFNAPLEVHDCFFEGYSTPGALSLIKKRAGDFDAILIVGHEEFLTAFLAEYFRRKELREIEFPMAAACIIDVPKNSFFMIT